MVVEEALAVVFRGTMEARQATGTLATRDRRRRRVACTVSRLNSFAVAELQHGMVLPRAHPRRRVLLQLRRPQQELLRELLRQRVVGRSEAGMLVPGWPGC